MLRTSHESKGASGNPDVDAAPIESSREGAGIGSVALVRRRRTALDKSNIFADRGKKLAPQPLAVGLLRVHPRMSMADWRAARSTLALLAAREGLTLLETFDVTADDDLDEPTYAAVEAITRREDAHALIVSGQVPTKRVRALAAALHLTVHSVPLRIEIP